MVCLFPDFQHTKGFGNPFCIKEGFYCCQEHLIRNIHQHRMIICINMVKILSANKIRAKLCLIICNKKISQFPIGTLFHQFLQIQSGFPDRLPEICCHTASLVFQTFVADPVILSGNTHIVQLLSDGISVQSAPVHTRHVILPELLIGSPFHAHSPVSLTFRICRHIRPLISIILSQIFTAVIGDHYLQPLESSLFCRKKGLFVKERGTACPTHGITVAILLFVGEHKLLQLAQCSVFAQKKIGIQVFPVQGNRDLPSVTIACRNIQKI